MSRRRYDKGRSSRGGHLGLIHAEILARARSFPVRRESVDLHGKTLASKKMVLEDRKSVV